MSSKEYFAKKDFKDLANACLANVASWSSNVGSQTEGISAVWWRNLKAYYSTIFGGDADSALGFAGQEGEIIQMLVPQARSLNTQFLSLTTKQKLTFDPQAESTDANALADTRVASALCEQTARAEHLDAQTYKMAEMASVVGIGYIMPNWDMMKGIPRVPNEEGTIVMSGDIDIFTPSIFDVVYDFSQEDFYKINSLMVRRPRNRWDLVAQYPHLENEILALASIVSQSDTIAMWGYNSSEDMVWEYHFIHKSSPALKDGRYTVFCSADTPLYDDENPYKNPDGHAFIPVVQMKPEPIPGCGFGYPFFSNILPMQQMMDANFGAIASNNAANGVQTILNPIGNDISVTNIGGLRFASYKPMNLPGGGKPEALQLTASSPETYKFTDMLRSYMMEVYNINGALRGVPPPGVTSGVAIATLATNALEFSVNFTKSYYEAAETCMTYVLWIYAVFASEDMIVSVTGPNDSTIAKKFKGSDLSPIKRVRVNIGNPLMATAAGKFEVADKLLQSGLVTSAKRYFKVLEGAPLKELYGIDFDQEAFIGQENDDLRDGKQVFVMPIDDDAQHIQSHASLLNDTEIRRNSQMLDSVMAHILEHYESAKTKDPMLMQMIKTGQMPQMPPGGAGQPPPGPGGPSMAPPEMPLEGSPADPAQSLMDPNQGAPGGITPPLAG